MCAARAQVVEKLWEQHKEQPTAVWVTHDFHMLELFSDIAGSTWSLVRTSPHGRACIVDHGMGRAESHPLRHRGPGDA